MAAALVNDPQVCEEAARVVDELLGEGHVVTDRELSLSGDNFAEFELYKPGAYAYLGTGNPDLPHTMITNHNGGFDVDENALVTGARSVCRLHGRAAWIKKAKRSAIVW